MFKLYLKGIIIGLGIITPLALVGGIAFASQVGEGVASEEYPYELTSEGYQYVWIEDDLSCSGLSAKIGVPIATISEGDLKVGTDIDGKPIIKRARKVVFKTLPSNTIIDKLDYEAGIRGLQRTGGKSVVDILQKADASVIK